MLAKLQQRKGAKGFTIIEVLIVLAIAGLIMMVVFLAVPALQRNARNTQRRNDVSSILGAYAETIANSGGALPADCNGTVTAPTPCWTRQANLGYYPNTVATDIVWDNSATAVQPAAVQNLDQVRIYNYTKCSTTTIGNTTNVGATNRSVVVLFAVELANGGIQPQCQES